MLVCRWTYIEFYNRYSILMTPMELTVKDKQQACKTAVQRIIQVQQRLYREYV